jgi:hypothetical protein
MADFSASKLISDLALLVLEGLALGLAYSLVTMAMIQFAKDAGWREIFSSTRLGAWMNSLEGSD